MIAMLRHSSALPTTACGCSDCSINDAATLADPTDTRAIRAQFRARLFKQWSLFRRTLRENVLDRNILGLDTGVRSAGVAFGRPEDVSLLRAFQKFVDDNLAAFIVPNEASYLRPMVVASYTKGVDRAASIREFDAPETRANLTAKTSTLHQLTFMELQGINEAVSQNLVRIATQAVIQKNRPRKAMAAMARAIRSIGIVRSRALVNVMVIKAFGEGTLDTFSESGVRRVGTLAERKARPQTRDSAASISINDARRRLRGRRAGPTLRELRNIARAERLLERIPKVNVLTAGDDNVCPVCEDISEEGPYTINTARQLIPAHLNCRCAFIPAD